MFQAVKGTADLLPAQIGNYRRVEKLATQLAEQYGFSEIRTPVFERSDLFVRGAGVMSGLVERDLWSFHDKHGQKLALRADITPCVVRAYQQHKLFQEGRPARLYYVGPVFLLGKEGEQPSRQAHQFGVEVLGSASPALDGELLCMALELSRRLEIPDVRLELNSLGCESCRPAYYDALREFIASRQSEVCGTCRRKYRNHPTWMLSCGESSCQSLAHVSPTILGYLCQDCKTHFSALKHLIQELDIETTFNPRVVRDVEYYSRSVFRLVSQGRTIGMGGRYDDLARQMGGDEVAGAGFALYLDEVVALLPSLEEEPEEPDFVFAPEGDESTRLLLPVAMKLRQAGARVEFLYQGGEAPPARWVVSLAEASALRGQAEISDGEARQPERCNVERLVARLQHLLGQAPRETDGESRHGRRRLSRTRRDRRPVEEAVAVEAVNEPRVADDIPADEAGEEASDRRRKRRRRRRGEGDEEAAVESVREEAPRTPPPARVRETAPRPEPRRAEPVKAFIPSLVLGNAAPPRPPAEEPVVLKPKPEPKPKVKPAPEAVPVAAAAGAAGADPGLVNWSIRTRAVSNGHSAEAAPDQVSASESAPRRRGSRRR